MKKKKEEKKIGYRTLRLKIASLCFEELFESLDLVERSLGIVFGFVESFELLP